MLLANNTHGTLGATTFTPEFEELDTVTGFSWAAGAGIKYFFGRHFGIRNGILSTLLLAMNSSVSALYGQVLMKKYCEDSPLTKIKATVMPSRQIFTAIRSDLIELGFGPFQQQMPDVFEVVPVML